MKAHGRAKILGEMRERAHHRIGREAAERAQGAELHRVAEILDERDVLGAALARMEIKVAAQEIIRRLDDIRLAMPAEEITYLPTLGTQTLTRLPLTFRRRG